MGLLSGDCEPEGALLANSASFWAILNRDMTTIGRHTNNAAGAEGPTPYAPTLDEAAHNDKDADISEDQACIASVRTNSPVTLLSRKELKSLLQVEAKSYVEAAQRQEMRSVSWDLVGDIICGVSATGYWAGTENIENSSFLFVKNSITEKTRRGALDETLNQNFNPWSRIRSFIQVSAEKIVNKPSFITPGAAFVRRHVINTVEEELEREPQVTKKAPSR